MVKILKDKFDFLKRLGRSIRRTTSSISMAGTTRIQHMPDEVLVHIFRNLDKGSLWYSVKWVCRRWNGIARLPCLWQNIEAAGQKVSTETLCDWLRNAKTLKQLRLIDRRDANRVLEQVSQSNRQIETIEAVECRGRPNSLYVMSRPLCNLLSRCPHITNINFRGTHFRSTKFYRLMAMHNSIHAKKRRRKDQQTLAVHPINYYGCANAKQIRAFLQARRDLDSDYLAHLQFDGAEVWRLSDMDNVAQRLTDPAAPVEAHTDAINALLEYVGLL